MFLFNKLGIYPFFGAITASLIGYTISFMLPCIFLKKDLKLNYKPTFNIIKKMILPTILMTITLLILNLFLPINSNNFFTMLGIIIIYTLIGGLIFLTMTYKNGALEDVFGKEYINKIIKKMKLKK